MILKYKILSIDEIHNQLVVRYFTDQLSEADLTSNVQKLVDDVWQLSLREDGSPIQCRTDTAIDLPYPPLEGDPLRLWILDQCPVKWLERMETVKASGPQDLDHIDVDVAVTAGTKEAVLQELKIARILRQEEAEAAAAAMPIEVVKV